MPTDRTRRLRFCRLCSAGSMIPVLDLGVQALTGIFPSSSDEAVGAGPLILEWCPACTLLQLAHSFDPTEMYGDNYGYRSGLNGTMVTHLTRKVAGLERLCALREGDVVIDIGSNDGTLLGAYTTKGLRRIGVDPTIAKFLTFYAPGIETVSDFFSADKIAPLDLPPAKIVTSIAMFYDLEDPLAFARDIAACLAPGGLWHFEQSYMPSMLRSTSYDTVCHEHLEYYSLANVQRVLDKVNLELVDVRFNRVNGGSFAVSAAKPGPEVPARNPLVDWFLEQERRMTLTTPAPFRDFERRVFEHRDDLTGLVRKLRSSGATVAGYGASTKGNVLLQFCRFTPDDIFAIGEINPDKFGHVTPGTGIPIVGDQEVRERRPDYVLVLPWHFREGIVHRERDYLEDGGRLIFPLPEIEIVGN